MKLLGKAISGTCGARTYSVGGAGVTARQKVCPVNKNSIAQARRRGLFAAAASAFKALSALQREELHARAVAASETDIFGKKIVLSDYAFFLREWMRGRREQEPQPPTREEAFSLLMAKSTGNYFVLDGISFFLFGYDEQILTLPVLSYNFSAGVKNTQPTPADASGRIRGLTTIERGGEKFLGLFGNIAGVQLTFLYGVIAESREADARAIYFKRIFQ